MGKLDHEEEGSKGIQHDRLLATITSIPLLFFYVSKKSLLVYLTNDTQFT